MLKQNIFWNFYNLMLLTDFKSDDVYHFLISYFVNTKGLGTEHFLFIYERGMFCLPFVASEDLSCLECPFWYFMFHNAPDMWALMNLNTTTDSGFKLWRTQFTLSQKWNFNFAHWTTRQFTTSSRLGGWPDRSTSRFSLLSSFFFLKSFDFDLCMQEWSMFTVYSVCFLH